MGLGHSPRIVTDGIVLSLDAGNTKNYNVGVSTNWTDKVGGNNGTLVGGTYHNDGPFVGAGYVEFVKSDNDGFNVSNSTGWFNPNNTSQWTLEGWILNPSSTNVFGIYSGTNGSIANFGCSIGGSVSFQSGNGAWAWVTNSTIVADTGSPTGWNHFAFTKNGSTFEVFLNGSRIYTGTPTFGTGTTGGSVHLQSYFSDTLYYNDAAGLSNVRYVTGSVLYSGTSYTVPTKPFTAIGGTQLLIYQGNTFTDASSNDLTLTKQNSPTANLGFPASAFEFDGVDDYVAIPDNDDFNIGSQNTMEVLVKLNAVGNSKIFYGKTSTWLFTRSYVNIGVQLDRFGISFHDGSGWSSLSSTTVASAGSWFHLVATWDGTYMRLYVNGSLERTSGDLSSKTWNTTSNTLDVGGYSFYPSYGTNCNIPVARIYHDRALTASEVEQNYNALKGRYV
jgi:hypothetical protein